MVRSRMGDSGGAWLLLVATASLLLGPAAPQLEAPPTSGSDGEYQPPNLSRGLGTVSDGSEAGGGGGRRYPDRGRSQSRSGGYDPGSDFRQSPAGGRPGDGFSYDPYAPGGGGGSGGGRRQDLDYPTSNRSSAYQPRQPLRTTARPAERPRLEPTQRSKEAQADLPPQERSGGGGGRDPFDDPNRYRVPQQHEVREGVKFVNGRPYR